MSEMVVMNTWAQSFVGGVFFLVDCIAYAGFVYYEAEG